MAFSQKNCRPARLFVLAVALWLGLGLSGGSLARAEGGRPACSWLLGLSRGGSTGMFDLPLADPGCPWQLRVGVFGQGFVQYNFLLVDDRNEQMSGALELGATLGPYVEAWLQIGALANRNQRPSTESSPAADPTLALGSTSLGLKLHSAWGRLGHVAIMPTVRVHSGPFDFGPSFSSIDAGIDVLGSLDLSAAWPKVPLRLSARVGYLHDRSSSLIAALDCMAAGNAECLATRLIYTTAYDVGQPRVIIGLGLDARFRVSSRMWFGPMASYSLGVVTSEGDPVLRAQLAMQSPNLADDIVNARVAQMLSFGARLVLPWSVALDLGMQVAISSWGYAMGPKLPQVAGYGSLSFALDVGSAEKRSRTGDLSGSEPPSKDESQSASGGVRGTVLDAQQKTPLADAVVRFIGLAKNALLTDEHGSFSASALPAGPLAVEASRGDHQTARVVVVVRPGEIAAANLELNTAQRSAQASLWVELTDEAGAVTPGLVQLYRPGPFGARGDSQGQRAEPVVELAPRPGGLYARLAFGSWRMRVDAAGYLSREQVVVLAAGAERRLSVRLTRRPAVPRVRLSGGEIELVEPLLFTGNARRPQLVPASGLLLDEVSDLLIHHLELRQLRIEAVGPGDEAQLIAVRDYLVTNGIAPERIIVLETPGEPNAERSSRIILRVVR